MNSSFDFDNLDERCRRFMVEEIELDAQSGETYISPRLNDLGAQRWPALLREAAEHGTEASLAEALRSGPYLRDTEGSHSRTGRAIVKSVPVNAPQTLSEGEFNRLYARAICRIALELGMTSVEVYRAKAVANPRGESLAMAGTHLHARALLEDLRTHQGVDTALGLPPGPNSGLSVRLPTS